MNVRLVLGASLLALLLATTTAPRAVADDKTQGKGNVAPVTSAELGDLRKKVLETIVAAEDAPDLEGRLKEVLEEFADKHNPRAGTLFQGDGFVLCLGHGGGPNEDGSPASVSWEAPLVVAVGGRGGDSATGRRAKAGQATARNEKGIAIAIGGRGARGGGGGAGGSAQSPVGSIGFGGRGGEGVDGGGRGGKGGGSGVSDLAAIKEAATKQLSPH
jgi:hypothetical protein